MKETIINELYWPEEFPDRGKCVFLDIETTGLSYVNSMIYLIGLAVYENNSWILRQYFAKSLSEEMNILKETKAVLEKKEYIISFNGSTFDIPFIKSALDNYGYAFDYKNSLDLMRFFKPFQKRYGLENGKQATYEKFVGFIRKDDYTGKQLVDMYSDYFKGENIDSSVFLRHNYLDIQGMFATLEILKLKKILSGRYTITMRELGKDKLGLRLCFDEKINYNVHMCTEDFDVCIGGNECDIWTRVTDGRVKLFYKNYKDYYYLPLEDRAVHKVIAEFVDRDYKEKARRDNCYSREEAVNCIGEDSIGIYIRSIFEYLGLI